MHSAPLSTRVFDSSLWARLAVGWFAYLASIPLRRFLSQTLPGPVLVLALAVVIAVIVVCSYGVVVQAEHLASRLGDPYGTLILTISIAMIEVILISAVMLGPGDHQSIARDSVMAVSMIIMNLVIGVSILVATRKQGDLHANRPGVFAYLTLLLILSCFAFVLPIFIGREGQYLPLQQVVVSALTVVIYGLFLFFQMGSKRHVFQEVALAVDGAQEGSGSKDVGTVLKEHRSEILQRTVALVLLMIPVVLLSHDMASLLDTGLGRLGAPVALSGLLIAMIVFLPETITTVRAAAAGQMQRVSNLCHGALLSTMGLTIPAVLMIGFFTGQPVLLAEDPLNLVLLGATYLLTFASFGLKRVRSGFGYLHLLLFMLFVLGMLS